MQKKILNIILVFVVGAFVIPNLSLAQEGEVIEEKSETSDPLPQDSLPISEASQEEGQEIFDVLPVGPLPNLKLSKVPFVETVINKEDKKLSPKSGEKIKTEEPQSNHSFNFIYYLFYKFKLADSSGN